MRPMRRVLASAILMAAAIPFFAGNSGCAERAAELTMVPFTPLPDLQSVGLASVWQRQVPMDPGERVKSAWRVGSSVYVATTMSRIARMDAKTGVLMWSDGLGIENFDIYKPIEIPYADGTPPTQVLVVSRAEAFIINMITGDIVRNASLGLSVSADPLLIGNILCVAGAGKFYGLYFDRLGGHRWLENVPGDLFESAPVAVDSSLIFASRKGYLWRIKADSGDWEWKDRKTNGSVVAGLAADGRAVYVPALDQRVYAFSVDTGGELWEQQLEGRLETTPVLGGSVVMTVSQEHGLYGLARQDGAIKWNVPDVSQVATVNENSAWVGLRDGTFKSISLETGEVLASAPAEGVQLCVRNPIDKNVILVTRGGLVGVFTAK